MTKADTQADDAMLKEQLGRMVRVKAGLEKIERNAREVAALLPPKAVNEMRFSQGVIELAQDLQQLADEVAELTKDAVTELQELREGRSSSEPPPQPQPSWRTEAHVLSDVARQNPRRGGAFLLGDKALPEAKR